MHPYIPISIKFLLTFDRPLPFDVFVERAEGKFTLIYKKDSTKDQNQIDRYLNKNIKSFFINREHKVEFENFLVELNPVNKFENSVILEIISTGLELNFEHFDLENDDLKTNMNLAIANVKSAIFLLEQDIVLAMEIFKALSSKSKLLKHSYMVSILSITLAKKIGLSSSQALLSIGLGGLLHDIGQSIFEKGLIGKSNLSHKEWEEFKDHPQLGLKILDHNKYVSSEVRSIIIQHHEQFNGRGYPNRLHNNLIYPPAKIVSIADGFCSLVGTSSYGSINYSASRALEMMNEDIGHFDPEYLKIFTEMMSKKN